MGDTSKSEGCITHGPWGSLHGEEWVYKPEGYITKIIVHFNKVIDAIEFHSSCSNGETHDFLFGDHLVVIWKHPICIDYPNEYLVSLSGTYGRYAGIAEGVLTSICFKTNQNHYGPFGSHTGTVFSYDLNGGEIVGFHGRAASYINAIGIYVRPKSFALGPNLTYKGKNKNEPCSREAGPWGASGGKMWDDGVFLTIKQVDVYLGKLNAIYALEFVYLKSDGELVYPQIHGRTNGCNIETVRLNGKDEYLTGISGFYGPVKGYDGLEAIVSISFHTNKSTHGPFGEEIGAGYVYFSSTSLGKVVGFHGRNNGFLGAIGVHMEYF